MSCWFFDFDARNFSNPALNFYHVVTGVKNHSNHCEKLREMKTIISWKKKIIQHRASTTQNNFRFLIVEEKEKNKILLNFKENDSIGTLVQVVTRKLISFFFCFFFSHRPCVQFSFLVSKCYCHCYCMPWLVFTIGFFSPLLCFVTELRLTKGRSGTIISWNSC